jgi:hypothetical protein
MVNESESQGQQSGMSPSEMNQLTEKLHELTLKIPGATRQEVRAFPPHPSEPSPARTAR